jgi:adenosylcobinamide-GDP ribazoletransferase
MKGALMALKFLTLGGRIEQLTPRPVSASILYFPLVGIFFGLVLVFLNRLSDPYLESEILATLLIAILALLTGASHFDGLRNTFDTLSAKMALAERQRSSGAFRVLAIVLVVLLKVQALIVTGETRSLGLLLTPMFARWSLIIFLYGSASIAEGSARILAVNMRAWHLVLTTAVVVSFAFFL